MGRGGGGGALNLSEPKANTDKVAFIFPLPFLRLRLSLDRSVVRAYSIYIQYIYIYCPMMMICIHASWCDDNDNLFLIHCT